MRYAGETSPPSRARHVRRQRVACRTADSARLVCGGADLFGARDPPYIGGEPALRGLSNRGQQRRPPRLVALSIAHRKQAQPAFGDLVVRQSLKPGTVEAGDSQESEVSCRPSGAFLNAAARRSADACRKTGARSILVPPGLKPEAKDSHFSQGAHGCPSSPAGVHRHS